MNGVTAAHGALRRATVSVLLAAGIARESLAEAPQPRERPPASMAPVPEWPGGPRLERAPDFAAWTITISPLKTPKPVPQSSPETVPARGLLLPPKLLRITRTGNILRQERTDASGKTSELWTRGAIQLVILQEHPQPLPCEPGAPLHALFDNLRAGDFPELAWIQKAHFQGIHPFAGRACLIFWATGPEEPGGKALACIDLETRLPAASQCGNEVRIYRFLKPPKSALKPPQAVQEYFERRENAWRSLQRPLPSP
jgi:hypothetical protein